MTLFWDASAFVPLLLPVQNGRRIRPLLQRSTPVVWWGTRIEILSSIARLKREGVLVTHQVDAAIERVAKLCSAWHEIDPTDRVRDLASDQIFRHQLRAGDALQLAAALVWCNEHPRNRVFVTLDRRLRAAALATGFTAPEL